MVKKLFQGMLIALSLAIIPLAGASAVSYSGTIIEPEADGITYIVEADADETVTLTDVLGVGNLDITFENSVSGSIVITASADRPDGATANPSGTVNLYFDVDLIGLTNDDISGATLTFTVLKSWLAENGFTSANIVLQHFGSAWENLTTREVSSTDTTITFEATVTSFSPFAIIGVPGLSDTGSPYLVGAIIAIVALGITIGTFVASKRNRNSAKA